MIVYLSDTKIVIPVCQAFFGFLCAFKKLGAWRSVFEYCSLRVKLHRADTSPPPPSPLMLLM